MAPEANVIPSNLMEILESSLEKTANDLAAMDAEYAVLYECYKNCQAALANVMENNHHLVMTGHGLRKELYWAYRRIDELEREKLCQD